MRSWDDGELTDGCCKVHRVPHPTMAQALSVCVRRSVWPRISIHPCTPIWALVEGRCRGKGRQREDASARQPALNFKQQNVFIRNSEFVSNESRNPLLCTEMGITFVAPSYLPFLPFLLPRRFFFFYFCSPSAVRTCCE